MKKLFIIIAMYLVPVFYESCGNPYDFNPPGDNMTGIVTFVDTNLMTTNGYYAAAVYIADSANPFERCPLKIDSLVLKMRDNQVYEGTFDINGIGAGKYFVAAIWVRCPPFSAEIPKVLGTYGCDTSKNCTTHTTIYYPNYQGNFRDFNSWTDTAKKLN
jgi:hypothetical protein